MAGPIIPIRSPPANVVASLGGAMKPQSSPLASIPLEVLLHINRHLTTPEYCNLRLTCKHIEDQLLNAFAREFFQKKQFMFTEFSLQALVDISKSRFASTLKHVIFGLEQPQKSPPMTVPSQTLSPASAARQNRLIMDWLNHSTFLNTGQNVEMLAEAFSTLPCLETVGLRDFNSNSRHRDRPNTFWNSYGAPTYFKETGSHMLGPYNRQPFGVASASDQVSFVHRAFQDILRGAGKASIPLKDFEIILRTYPLNDRAFILPKYLEPTISPVLANLRTIFLDLNSDPPFIHVEAKNGLTPCPSYSLMKFLSSAVNLEHLRLNFSSYHSTESILSWLSRSPPTYNPTAAVSPLAEPQPVELKNLKQLDIGMTTVEPKVILAIIRKHRATLRVISLHKVIFIHTADVPADERVNLWAKLFKDLSTLDLKLDAINMSLLSQQQPGGQHKRHVSFRQTPKKHTKRWAGNDTQSGLRDFQAQVTIEMLDQDTPQPSDESSDEAPYDSMDDDLDDEDEDPENEYDEDDD